TRSKRDWSSDVCSSDLAGLPGNCAQRCGGISPFRKHGAGSGDDVVAGPAGVRAPGASASAFGHGVCRRKVIDAKSTAATQQPMITGTLTPIDVSAAPPARDTKASVT